MSFQFPCSQCGESYEVGEADVGRRFRCKQCDEICVVEKPRRSATPKPKPAPKSVRDKSEDDSSERQAKRRTPSASRSQSTRNSAADEDAYEDYDFDEDDAPTPRTRPRKRPKAKSFSMPSWLSLPGASRRYLIPLIVGVVTFLLGLASPMAGMAFGFVFFAAGMIKFAIGSSMGVAVAFSEDFVCGLLYLFCPFYAFHHHRTRREEHAPGQRWREDGGLFIIALAIVFICLMILHGAYDR